MGYQPRIKSPKGAIRKYNKSPYERGKGKKRVHDHAGRPAPEEKQPLTEREISELTLRQLHTLGSQRFGSSPFSQHFDRWLNNVTAVLCEFELNPNIVVDDQFVEERSEALSAIKLRLDEIGQEEAAVNQEVRSLSDYRNRLEHINTKYLTMIGSIRDRKKSDLKNLYRTIDHLKKDQDKVIKMKTGFFHGISRKEREQKETEITQELSEKQREVELAILELNVERKQVREEWEQTREPVSDQIKYFQKRIDNLETDGSLEERWFACETLIDAVNAFLQRKAAQASDSSKN